MRPLVNFQWLFYLGQIKRSLMPSSVASFKHIASYENHVELAPKAEMMQMNTSFANFCSLFKWHSLEITLMRRAENR